jgi:TPP-dependent pyruvate/acetoin dehydrogenase alpha subunit
MTIEDAAYLILKIRRFEESLDSLFENGVIHGTFHRCIGQEATAVAVTALLDPSTDFVVSNHRNHGHYLGFTRDFEGLFEELKGTPAGVSGGQGGSQCIFGDNFLSTGILGSTVPAATGISLGFKRRQQHGIVACFVGDGALCEGVVYESFNMASLWKLPILYVIEHNNVAQSAAVHEILSGEPAGKLSAFDIETATIVSTDVSEIMAFSAPLIDRVRSGRGPQGIVVQADRLCAHSKGDDFREESVQTRIRKGDPLLHLQRSLADYAAIDAKASQEIEALVGVA